MHLVLHLSSGRTLVIANSSFSFEKMLKEAMLGEPRIFSFGSAMDRISFASSSIELIERIPARRVLNTMDYNFYVEDQDSDAG